MRIILIFNSFWGIVYKFWQIIIYLRHFFANSCVTLNVCIHANSRVL